MKTVQIILFDGVDELDVCGPYELLASCRKLVNGHWGDKAAFHVETVAEHRATVECAHSLKINADRTMTNAHPADIVIVPGGPGARREVLPAHILEYVQKAYAAGSVVASVCTGAFVLARAGLTDGYEVATHHVLADTLQKMYPRTKVVHDQRVVVSGKNRTLMSCGGVTAGIDLALCLITRTEGQQAAVLAGKRVEWPGYYRHEDRHHHPESTQNFVMRPSPNAPPMPPVPPAPREPAKVAK